LANLFILTIIQLCSGTSTGELREITPQETGNRFVGENIFLKAPLL